MLRLAAVLVVSLTVAAGIAPAARAHDVVDTAAGHAAEDAVVHTAAQESMLDADTRAVTAKDAAAAAAAVAGAPQDVGEWGPVVDWPVIGVHVALLPNGKVLAYDSVGTTQPRPTRSTSTPGTTSSAAGWRIWRTAGCSSPAATRTKRSTASSRRTSSIRRATR